MPEKPITERTLAKHVFTTEERLAMSEELTSHMREIEVLEDQLTSIKSDYKSKLEREGLQRDTLAQKLRDKYEMREAKAEVRLGVPAPGRKSYYYAEPYPGHFVGEFIKEEQMTHSDLQRTLPLEDKPKEEVGGHPYTMGETQGKCAVCGQGPNATAHNFFTAAEPAVAAESQPAPGQLYDATAEGMVPVTDAPKTPFSLADRILQAAGKELPLVQISFEPGYAPSKYRGQFAKAAKRQGWPEAAIKVMDDAAAEVIDNDATISENGKRVLEVLSTHCEPVPEKPAAETAGGEEVQE